MQAIPFAQSPFAALTFVAAPAILTNASSVLAMSTIELTAKASKGSKKKSAKTTKGSKKK
jgi:hypothetical protein